MPSTPSSVLRAMEGLTERSGRVIVVAGPPLSGKSALLEDVRARLKEREAHLFNLRGSFRTRSIPFGALNGLAGESEESTSSAEAEPLVGEVPIVEIPAGPLAPGAYLPGRLPSSRRGRGERGRTSFLGEPLRQRSANEGDPEAFWRQILPHFRGAEAHPVGLVIEDGSLFDTESRDFIVTLSRKARLRPFLITIALDTSVPGYTVWEDAFLGRADVDWVRFAEGAPDPREAHRLKAIYDDLPSVSRRVVGYVALLGGSVGEVVLSRVARLNFPQLAEALLPATGVGIVKASDGKVLFPHLPWVTPAKDLIPEKQRQQMHLDIANALSALSPEPSLPRRIEIAHHYLEWSPGPMALQNLLDAADVSLRLLSFDTAEELLGEAILCLAGVPPAERDTLEPQVRLLHAQALFAAGRPGEAERELREGVETGLRAHIDHSQLAEWVEPLIPEMRVIGPRPSLLTELVEIAERCHDSSATEVEVLVQALIAEFYYERNLPEKARAESHRAATLARRLPTGPLHALALLAVAISRIDGSPREQELAAQFLKAARLLFVRARRWELDHLAADLEARLLEARGDLQGARELRERAVPALQRAKLPSIELYQELGIAEAILNRGGTKGVDSSLDRARTITDILHLTPPSPGLLRTWLLEGRRLALNDSLTDARERWQAIIDLPAASSLPRVRAEAMVRLALLEFSQGRNEEGEAIARELARPEILSSLPTAWVPRLADLAKLAPQSDRGGGPFPPTAKSERPSDRERRNRAGR